MRAGRSRLAMAVFGAYVSVQLQKLSRRMMLYSGAGNGRSPERSAPPEAGNGSMAPGPAREARE